MNYAAVLTKAFASLQTNDTFSETVVSLSDESQLCFCHRVDKRWAKAIHPGAREDDSGLAGKLLAAISIFRLNAKHLDIQFDDGSRWEKRFPRAATSEQEPFE